MRLIFIGKIKPKPKPTKDSRRYDPELLNSTFQNTSTDFFSSAVQALQRSVAAAALPALPCTAVRAQAQSRVKMLLQIRSHVSSEELRTQTTKEIWKLQKQLQRQNDFVRNILNPGVGGT